MSSFTKNSNDTIDVDDDDVKKRIITFCQDEQGNLGLCGIDNKNITSYDEVDILLKKEGNKYQKVVDIDANIKKTIEQINKERPVETHQPDSPPVRVMKRKQQQPEQLLSQTPIQTPTQKPTQKLTQEPTVFNFNKKVAPIDEHTGGSRIRKQKTRRHRSVKRTTRKNRISKITK